MQQTQDFDTMLVQCWASGVDAGPTLNQHCFIVLYLFAISFNPSTENCFILYYFVLYDSNGLCPLLFYRSHKQPTRPLCPPLVCASDTDSPDALSPTHSILRVPWSPRHRRPERMQDIKLHWPSAVHTNESSTTSIQKYSLKLESPFPKDADQSCNLFLFLLLLMHSVYYVYINEYWALYMQFSVIYDWF